MNINCCHISIGTRNHFYKKNSFTFVQTKSFIFAQNFGVRKQTFRVQILTEFLCPIQFKYGKTPNTKTISFIN